MVVITIRYCNLCRWGLRANWLAQELLSTFDGQLGQLRLEPASGGLFQVFVDQQLLWDRRRDGGFPEAKQLKQRLRDVIEPDRDLGHIDKK